MSSSHKTVPVRLLVESPTSVSDAVATVLLSSSPTMAGLWLRKQNPDAQVLYDFCQEHGITKLRGPMSDFIVKNSLAHRWIVRDVCLYGNKNLTPIDLIPIDRNRLNTWLGTGIYKKIPEPRTSTYEGGVPEPFDGKYPPYLLNRLCDFKRETDFSYMVGYIASSTALVLNRRFKLYYGLSEYLPSPEPIL